MRYARPLLGHFPHSEQCTASASTPTEMQDARLRCSRSTLTSPKLVRALASTSRIGPTCFFSHHSGECLSRCTANQASMKTMAGIPAALRVGDSITFTVIAPPSVAAITSLYYCGYSTRNSHSLYVRSQFENSRSSCTNFRLPQLTPENVDRRAVLTAAAESERDEKFRHVMLTLREVLAARKSDRNDTPDSPIPDGKTRNGVAA